LTDCFEDLESTPAFVPLGPSSPSDCFSAPPPHSRGPSAVVFQIRRSPSFFACFASPFLVLIWLPPLAVTSAYRFPLLCFPQVTPCGGGRYPALPFAHPFHCHFISCTGIFSGRRHLDPGPVSRHFPFPLPSAPMPQGAVDQPGPASPGIRRNRDDLPLIPSKTFVPPPPCFCAHDCSAFPKALPPPSLLARCVLGSPSFFLPSRVYRWTLIWSVSVLLLAPARVEASLEN